MMSSFSYAKINIHTFLIYYCIAHHLLEPVMRKCNYKIFLYIYLCLFAKMIKFFVSQRSYFSLPNVKIFK